ncbi:hypothetical protein ACI65C_005199 [Semiaphis heraclei]
MKNDILVDLTKGAKAPAHCRSGVTDIDEVATKEQILVAIRKAIARTNISTKRKSRSPVYGPPIKADKWLPPKSLSSSAEY